MALTKPQNDDDESTTTVRNVAVTSLWLLFVLAANGGGSGSNGGVHAWPRPSSIEKSVESYDGDVKLTLSIDNVKPTPGDTIHTTVIVERIKETNTNWHHMSTQTSLTKSPIPHDANPLYETLPQNTIAMYGANFDGYATGPNLQNFNCDMLPDQFNPDSKIERIECNNYDNDKIEMSIGEKFRFEQEIRILDDTSRYPSSSSFGFNFYLWSDEGHPSYAEINQSITVESEVELLQEVLDDVYVTKDEVNSIANIIDEVSMQKFAVH